MADPSLDYLGGAGRDRLYGAADRDRRLPARLDQRELSPLRQTQLRLRATGSSRARAVDPWTRTVAGRGTKGRQLSAGEVDKVRGELANYQQFAAVTEEIVAV